MNNSRLLHIYNKIKDKLSNAGVYAPAFESFIIIKEVFNKSYIDLTNDDLTVDKINILNNILKKREEGLPLQYILGEWEFWGLKFKVGDGVLIPRSDTEVLVEISLNEIKDLKNPMIIDLCSGSGCIAISLAKERPDAIVYAVEKSKKAYKYLQTNIGCNEVKNVYPVLADIFDKKYIQSNNKFDLIVSNPPYIKSDEISNLQREVKFEPIMALDGGADGLDFYKHIINVWSEYLNNRGTLVLEIGINQCREVIGFMKKKGLSNLNIKNDLEGICRVVYGKGTA